MPLTRQVYLDHSATTPTDPRVVEAMLPYFTEAFGNASSVHSFGRRAERAVEDSRETIARILNCSPSEIVFTSGGTESNNLAIRGAAWNARTGAKGKHIITSPVEHEASGRTVAQLAEIMGFERTVLPVDHYGMVSAEDFSQACRPETTVASIMYANNEVGTIKPIHKLAAIARQHDILFHTDAVQAAGQLSLDVQALGVDMLSISGHKFYGPKGVGILYVRDGLELLPSQSGGSHEGGRRSGTHNTPAIVGLAKALAIAYDEFQQHVADYQAKRDHLIDSVLTRIPTARLTGHPKERLPSHASFTFEGADGNLLLTHLDLKGVAASSGSACKVGDPEPSDVLLAMGYTREQALSTLRLTVGRQTTYEDIDYAVDVLDIIIEKLTALNPA